MKSIIDISTAEMLPSGFAAPYDAILSTARGHAIRSRGPFHLDRPVFVRLDPLADPDRMAHDDHDGLAVDVPNGQFDLDHISATLRLVEARRNRSDRSIRLLAFFFPDLASLAVSAETLAGSERLYGIAFDETALSACLPIDDMTTPAPLLYARARIVAAARAVACPAYLKPRWSDNQDTNLRTIETAKQDGFDGLIGPPTIVGLINSA